MDYHTQLEIEDMLQANNVFVNGLTNKPAHSDSYMTVVEPENAMKVIKENPQIEWNNFKERVLKNPNTQIPMKIFCAFIQKSI